MDLSPTDEQAHLRDTLTRFLAKAASPERVREAEPLGFDREVWDGLVEIGAVAMGLPATHGGAGAALADLAVVAERAGSGIAPAPVVEAMVAARLLASCVGPDDAWLGRVAEGTALVTLAVRPAASGTATLVPGAAVADAALVFDADAGDLVLVPLRPSGSAIENLASSPLADIATTAADRVVLASGHTAASAYAVALDEWRALTACWLGGLSRAALDLGVQYARDRKQFGVPIGSFQAVQQTLADVATDLDGAELLAAKAVWALDEHEAVADRFASMAFSFSAQTAEKVTSAALHFHGGYGFMEEYDVQLYFRRAKGTRLLLGDPRGELLELADRIFPGATAPATTQPAVRRLRHAAGRATSGAAPTSASGSTSRPSATRCDRSWPSTSPTTWSSRPTAPAPCTTGTSTAPWQRRAGSRPAGPSSTAAAGARPLEMNVLSEEMYLSGAPVDGMGIASLVAHTILLEGSDWQKATIVPRILSGEVICCLGYSEPESGSDVAACTTKAERGRRRVGDQRPEDVHHARPRVRLRVPAHPHQHRGGQAQGPHHVRGADGHPRHRHHPGAHHGRRAHQHHLLRRRAGARPVPGRRRRRGVEA